jgi:osmotically-inducible protein OsmY
MANHRGHRDDFRGRDEFDEGSRQQGAGYGGGRWQQDQSGSAQQRGGYGDRGRGQHRGENWSRDFAPGGGEPQDYRQSWESGGGAYEAPQSGVGEAGYGDYDRDDYRSRGGGRSAGYGAQSGAYSGPPSSRYEDRQRGAGAWSGYPEARGSDHGEYGHHSRSAGSRSSGRPYGGGERGYSEGGRDFWDKAGDEVSSWFGDKDAERRREMDQFRGRGPKSYARSDERIKEDVNDRLTDDGALDASDIEVEVSNREVTLSGEVDSRFAKRRAEDIADSVSGVTHVQNNLRVKQNEWSGSGYSREGSSSISGDTTAGSSSETGARASTDATRKGVV